MIPYLEVCAGAGGFSLGFEMVGGFEPVAFCEIEPFPFGILEKRFPGVPVARDMKNLKYENGVLYEGELSLYAGPIAIVCGGIPCQPFSNAGKRRGAEDDRDLWPEMRRLVDEIRPRWVVVENVAGLGSMEFNATVSKVGSGFLTRYADEDFYRGTLSRQSELYLNTICQDLERYGYTVNPVEIPACAVGAPHQRQRVWIVAHATERKDQHGRRGNVGETEGSRGRCHATPCVGGEDVPHAANPGPLPAAPARIYSGKEKAGARNEQPE